MRDAYILTAGNNPKRAERSEKILKDIGFETKIIQAIPANSPICGGNKVKSNYLSFKTILEQAVLASEDWFYFFEDDIALVEEISLSEIIQYEKISSELFYLGCCLPTGAKGIPTEHIINSHIVYELEGAHCCLHALAFSKKGAKNLLEILSLKNKQSKYADRVVGEFAQTQKVFCVRYDLKSPQCSGHRGILFQDRQTFKSEI
jgi:hypothetical protein